MQSYYIYFRIHLYLINIYYVFSSFDIILLNRRNNKDTFQNKNNHSPVLQFRQANNMSK